MPIDPGSTQSQTEPLSPPRLTEPGTVVVTENEVIRANAYRFELKLVKLVDRSQGEWNQPVMIPLRRPDFVTSFPRLAHHEHMPTKVDVSPVKCQNLPATKPCYGCKVEAGIVMNVPPRIVSAVGKECPEILLGEDTALFFRSFILPTPVVGSRFISSRYSASRKITFTIPSALFTVAEEHFERSLDRRSSTSARVISESRLFVKGSLSICFSSR